MNSSQFSNPILKAPTAVTKANMRISAVDGTAFCDFSASTFTADNIRNSDYVEIYDSAKRKIGGFIKAAGTGETLGGEICTDPSFDDVSKWDSIGTGWAVSGGQATAGNTGNVSMYQNNTSIPYESLCFLSGVSSQVAVDQEVNITAWSFQAPYLTAAGTTSAYGTIPPSAQDSRRRITLYVKWGGLGSPSATWDSISLKQVLTPSVTGITITNTPGGSTYNWAVKNASFNYNDSSGYTYRIISRQAYSTLILNQDTVSGTLHIATVDGGAMFFHDSVDFSAYAGDDAGVTPYEVVFQDASGKCAVAYAGAQGGGESLDTEICTDPGFDNTGLWSKDSGWSVAGGVATAVNPANEDDVYQFLPSLSGWLLKAQGTCTIYGSGSWALRIQAAYGTNIGDYTSASTQTLYGTHSRYVDGSRSAGISSNGGLNGTFDNFSLKRVLDTPTTGLHLVSSLGGTTRNMKSVDSGFDPNTITKVRIYRTGQTQA